MSDNRTAYKEAGVNVEEGYRAVEMMKDHVKSTFTKGVLGGIGSFGGLFTLGTDFKEPVLVSGTDGVGTKLKIAFEADKHDTVGIDLVAMCVNDILCQGAKPLFFLDYIATGKLEAEKAANLVSGVAEGCRQSDMALLGGETAEMPGFYADGEYDMAGFAVGVVERENIIDGSKVGKGDVLIGIGSSGVHSNGYSLVRKLVFDKHKLQVSDPLLPNGNTVEETLLTPTKIYVKPVLAVLEEVEVHGMCHVTGGGFHENLPRMYPEGLQANIQLGSWEKPAVFDTLAQMGGLGDEEMFATFNMGIGFVLAVKAEDAEKVIATIEANGEKAYEIGSIESGEKGVLLCQN